MTYYLDEYLYFNMFGNPKIQLSALLTAGAEDLASLIFYLLLSCR